jgi:predicted TIM-barrel fold metal-dependent hydrolase
VPIIDLHFHPDLVWGDVSVLFDRVGVRAAGSGPSGPDSIAIASAQANPGRIIPFGGGERARDLVLRHGADAWDMRVAAVDEYLAGLEASLRAGLLVGIGEVHVNNWSSNIIGSPRYRYPADSPLLQRLAELAGRHRVPLSLHMDAEASSVAEMERLLRAHPDAALLWAHTGHFAEPDLLRRLLAEHPNLYCELSYRVSIAGSRNGIPVDQGGRLRDSWRQLIEEFPDRFVIGTDLSWPSPSQYEAHIAFWRRILEQLSPETAEKVAFRNAERILNWQQE